MEKPNCKIETSFYNENIVTCKACKGESKVGEWHCPLCNGTGKLQRIVEGVVKLYTTK